MLYLDTSFVAPLILEEASSIRIERFLMRQREGDVALSHWTRVEVSALLAREVRMAGLPVEEARGGGGDALHLAIGTNNGATAICSLDKTFVKAGRQLGLPVGTGIRLPGR